jgi:hypothetical protein
MAEELVELEVIEYTHKVMVMGVEIIFAKSSTGTYSWKDEASGLSGYNFFTYVLAVADARNKIYQDLHGRD